MRVKLNKRPVAAAILFSISLGSAHGQGAIDSSKAAFFIGKEAMVCGTVHEVKPFKKGTYINLGARYPNQHLGILIWEADRPRFESRFGGLSVFQGAQACVHGLIENYKSTLQVQVSNPQFLRLIK